MGNRRKKGDRETGEIEETGGQGTTRDRRKGEQEFNWDLGETLEVEGGGVAWGDTFWLRIKEKKRKGKVIVKMESVHRFLIDT